MAPWGPAVASKAGRPGRTVAWTATGCRGMPEARPQQSVPTGWSGKGRFPSPRPFHSTPCSKYNCFSYCFFDFSVGWHKAARRPPGFESRFTSLGSRVSALWFHVSVFEFSGFSRRLVLSSVTAQFWNICSILQFIINQVPYVCLLGWVIRRIGPQVAIPCISRSVIDQWIIEQALCNARMRWNPSANDVFIASQGSISFRQYHLKTY